MAVLVVISELGSSPMRTGISARIFWSRGCRRSPRALLALVTNFLALGFVGLTMLAAMAARRCICSQKGDRHMIWRVPLWPVAFAAAFGSLFLLTGVLLQLIARMDDPQRRTMQPEAVPNPAPRLYANSATMRTDMDPTLLALLILVLHVPVAGGRHADRFRDGIVGIRRHAVADRRAGRARAIGPDGLRDRA